MIAQCWQCHKFVFNYNSFLVIEGTVDVHICLSSPTQLEGPFKRNGLTLLHKQYNKAMSEDRASIEWVFGDIVNYFAFMDFEKNVKLNYR